ncbi:MAG TPA: FHA domain-containing protein [Kineosporiaceae bacterium]|nr:FHA domain-containing protein [Kineosporiaceae bacterium]
MSALTLTLLRLGFLALLWVFVISVAAVLRRDLYGTRVTRRATVPVAPRPSARPAPPPQDRPVQEPRRDTPRTLVVTEGSLQGTTLALGQATILIGRAPECTLVLEDDYASNRHARFTYNQGVWMIEDLGSTNGTFLGRSRIETPTPVEPGVSVRIGRTVLELRR